MGGVWCKADRGSSSPSSKGAFNTALSRWSDHVRQAYRKPKTYQRPMRPPKKPSRSSDRLTISHPHLAKEQSSDGWRTATLLVPEPAPVPPPRKKRKRDRHLARGAYSMDDLNHVEGLSKSTISLPDKCRQADAGLETRSSSTTLVVTPVLESRLDHAADQEHVEADSDKENLHTNITKAIEEDDEDVPDAVDITDEIIPIEKETLSSRTLLYSNLGYVDKLSAISEVSAESGFEDRIDLGKGSERSESVTSSESVPREQGLNIMAHIQNINTVSHLNDVNKDLREKTALSKREWLQNILKEDAEPYFISRDPFGDARRGSGSLILDAKLPDNSKQPNSLPVDHLHLMNRETEPSGAENTPPPTPEPTVSNELTPTPELDSTHSVLLDLLQKNSLQEANPFLHREESIFLTNTKTNIIYKSLSSDKLTDDYDSDYLERRTNGDTHLIESKDDILKCAQLKDGQDSTNPFTNFTSKSHLSDYSFQTPKLVESDTGLNSITEDKRSNVVSSFDFKEFVKNPNYVPPFKDPQPPSEPKSAEPVSNNLVNGNETDLISSPAFDKKLDGGEGKLSEDKTATKDLLTKKDSISSSRKSSITDSLHEFEMSIYDMLNESKKNRESSDEDDSLKTTKTESKK